MTPVMQTRTGHGGNCLAACLASIIDMPGALNSITECLIDVEGHTNQRLALARWLQARGMSCVPLQPWDDKFHAHIKELLRGVVCIASGISPRGHGHGVVWRDGVIHDPHPDGGGFEDKPYAFTIIFPLKGPFLEVL